MPAAEPPPTRLRYVDGVVGLFRPWMTDRRPAQGGCRHTSDAIEEKRAINIAHAVLHKTAKTEPFVDCPGAKAAAGEAKPPPGSENFPNPQKHKVR